MWNGPMRANDQVTSDFIQELELDNDHLRAEVIAKEQEIISLRQYIEILQKDREFSLWETIYRGG